MIVSDRHKLCIFLIAKFIFVGPYTKELLGFPGDSVGKESTCKAGDLGSIPGLGRSPGEGNCLPTPVFWPGDFHGLYSPWGRKESDTTEWVSHTKVRGVEPCIKVIGQKSLKLTKPHSNCCQAPLDLNRSAPWPRIRWNIHPYSIL